MPEVEPGLLDPWSIQLLPHQEQGASASQPICYTWQLDTTCTPHQQAAVENGAALIKDWIVQKPEPALA